MLSLLKKTRIHKPHTGQKKAKQIINEKKNVEKTALRATAANELSLLNGSTSFPFWTSDSRGKPVSIRSCTVIRFTKKCHFFWYIRDYIEISHHNNKLWKTVKTLGISGPPLFLHDFVFFFDYFLLYQLSFVYKNIDICSMKYTSHHL